MKTLWLIAAGMLVFAAIPASAADLPLPAKQPPLAQGFTWTGFFVGPNFGGAWGTVNYSGSNALGGATVATYAGSYGASGIFGGGQFGFNYEFPSNVVLGFQADFEESNLNGSTTSCLAVGCSSGISHLDNFGAVQGRLGYAFNNLLLYGTGGGAWGNGRSSVTITSSTAVPSLVGSTGADTSEPIGWAAGGGLEWAFLQNWTLKVEYQHLQFNGIQQTYNFGLFGAGGMPFVGTTGANLGVNTVRIGLNWLFTMGAIR